ncbi:hypothetical protein [Anaerococcus cruorum]|uniref:hypothetical protein n=1 Tax=Anaerococcus sp. WGS1529 TaxID=3366812 RepID=UPI00372CEAA6
MKRKKIYTGTLALALAIGVVSPVKNNEFSSVAYAADSQTSPNNEDSEETVPTDKEDSTNTGSQSEEKLSESQNPKIEELNNLTAEEANVKSSTRYKNASKTEQDAYTNAIANGKNVKEDTPDKEINTLIDNINEAKKNLGASSFATYQQREGLSSTIAIAEKLSASIADNTEVKKEDKDKLVSAINSAKAVEKDVNKSKDEITSSNNSLAQTIDDIVKANSLDANNSALTYDEIEKITPSETTSYGREYQRLGNLINSIYEFSKTDIYKNLSSDTMENLTNASNQASEVYNNLNSNSVQLNDAYNKLNAAYNSALDKADTQNNEISRLKKQIEEATSKNPNAYENAGDSARLTYDIAKARANELIAKDSTDAADLQKALNNLNLAKLALAPVKTKTIDNNQPKTSKQALQELINEADSYRNKDLYKLASDEDKKLYNNAITTAQAIVKKANPTDEEINAAIDTIKEIKDSIEKDGQNQKETDNEKLNRLIDDANTAINHPNYKNIAQQNRDDLEKALKKAQKAKKSADKEEILSAISDLEAALNNFDNEETLEELLELAKKVKEHNEYKNVGFTQRENLDKAITAANSALASGKATDIKIAKTGLVNALNQSEVKPIADLIRSNADTDDPSYVKELKNLIALANKVKNHPDYANVSENTKKWLDDILISSESALRRGNKESIELYTDMLKRQLNHKELRPIVKKIQDAESEKETLNPREIINKMISNDETLRKSEKYRRAQKSLKEAYNKALEEASDLIKNDEAKKEDLKSASSKLVEAASALDGDKYQARLKSLKDDFNSRKYDISDKAKRSELEEKIKALENDNATMDDLLAVEKEFKNATAVTGSTQPAQGTTTTTTTPVTGTTTTTTPVTTTRKVPTTINPGSIVRTGIKSLVGVAVVLVVALGAFALTGKNKNNKDKTKRRDNNEI